MLRDEGEPRIAAALAFGKVASVSGGGGGINAFDDAAVAAMPVLLGSESGPLIGSASGASDERVTPERLLGLYFGFGTLSGALALAAAVASLASVFCFFFRSHFSNWILESTPNRKPVRIS